MSIRPVQSSLAALSLLTLALVAAGCSNRPTLLQPETGSGTAVNSAAAEPGDALDLHPPGAHRGFFPLELGNRWRYVGRMVESFIPNEGEPTRDLRRYHVHTQLVCRERIHDRGYVVAREVLQIDDEVFKQWIRYRQDREGLYEADVPTSVRPDCDPPRALGGAEPGDAFGAVEPEIQIEGAVTGRRSLEDPETRAAYERARARVMARLELARRLAGSMALTGDAAAVNGVARGEIQRLAYPLRVGAHWLIRRDPRFAAHVLANEQLRLPAGRFHGWKVGIRSELFGPDDRVFFWVSRDGFLKEDIRLVGLVTDTGGDVIGRIVIHDERELSRISLGGPGRNADPHIEPAVVGLEP